MYSLSAEKHATTETTEAAPSLCILLVLTWWLQHIPAAPGLAIHQRCQQRFPLLPPPHLQSSILMARPHVAGAHHSNTHGRLTGNTLGVYCTSYGRSYGEREHQ